MDKNSKGAYLGKKNKPQEGLDEIIHQSASEEKEADFDSQDVVDLLLSIKAKALLNMSQRKAHPNDPIKYIDSEEKLNEDIALLQKLAAYPLLMPIFIQNNGVDLICSLLSHPNSDIVNPIINLIEEVTEGDFLQELEDPRAFLELLLANNLFGLLVEQLKQLFQESNEDNEQYKSDILSIIDNFIEIYPPSADILGQKTDILQVLISSVKYSESIEVKLFSSEILQSLLLNSEANKRLFASMQGIPHLINILVKLKERKDKGGAYEEFTSNIADAICSSLFIKSNQEIFSKADGVKSMIDFMLTNGLFRHLAMKVLNYSLQNNKENCNEFIEGNGLKVLFPYFMGKGIKNNSENAVTGEEHCIEVMVSLFKFGEGVGRDRLLYKFKEEKYSKCIRLIELYMKYRDKLMSKDNIEKNEEVNNEEYILQLMTIIILELMRQSKLMDLKGRVQSLLNERGIQIDEMRERIRVMLNSMEESDTKDESNEGFSYKQFLNNLVNEQE